MKYFIITIDTEGDNLWTWKDGDPIKTDNTLYLERFQTLCNKYGFKPVWLSNYEMMSDNRYVKFIKKVEDLNQGELGMHLHAWNSPPYYELPVEKMGAPYLIEYPVPVMDEKIKFLTNYIEEKTGIVPVTHRAGRWAINQDYFDLLIKHGYQVDCSVTPHINWDSCSGRTAESKGTDYSNIPEANYYLWDSEKKSCILEVPVTIRISHKLKVPNNKTIRKIAGNVIRAFRGQPIWIRPTGNNLKEMLELVNVSLKSDTDYMMFMLHSSELMPGGSPTFIDEASIEKLYSDLEVLFDVVSKQSRGITLREYAKLHTIENLGEDYLEDKRTRYEKGK